MTIEEIKEMFHKEFESIRDKFTIIHLLSVDTSSKRSLDREVIRKINIENIYHPGVYVFYGNGSPYRVGRHFTNTRLRVMQHIDANTGDEANNILHLNEFPDREVLLFNLKDPKDFHWAAALEVFFEDRLKEILKIPAKRQG